MKYIAEQKVQLVVIADTEEEARDKIKKNEYSCSDEDVIVMRACQQSWIVQIQNITEDARNEAEASRK